MDEMPPADQTAGLGTNLTPEQSLLLRIASPNDGGEIQEAVFMAATVGRPVPAVVADLAKLMAAGLLEVDRPDLPLDEKVAVFRSAAGDRFVRTRA